MTGRFDFHIIGAGRSGTSLLSALLNAHPDCTIRSETHSISILMGKVWTPSELLRDAKDRVRGRIDNFLRSCEADSAGTATRLWGHKTTTEQIGGLRLLHADSPFARDEGAIKEAEQFDFLHAFVSATKHIPVIYILRDGRTCIRSKLTRTDQSLEQAINNWKFGLKVLDAYRNAGTKLFLIKMEELVSAPETAMHRICNFVGLTYTPAMLSATDSDLLPEMYRRSHFDVSVLEHDNPPWVSEIRGELVAHGYTV